VPEPLTVTVSVSREPTRSTVLALLPELSVTVMVVVPAPIPVARPVASMVATAGSLLVHVRPVPDTVTGTDVLVVFPFAS
jgi:hypothetical protein